PLDNFGNAIAPAMNAGNKFDVLAACHGPLKTTVQAYRPGDPAIAGDGAFVCCIHTANDSEQSGLASAIATQQANAGVGGDSEVDVFEYPVPTKGAVVALIEVAHFNHCASSLCLNRSCSRSPRNKLPHTHWCRYKRLTPLAGR